MTFPENQSYLLYARNFFLFLGMPYLPKPQDHPTFRVYFTRDWQEIYLTSLNNFLSIAFRQMHLPTLLNFVAEQRAVHVAPEHQSSCVNLVVFVN